MIDIENYKSTGGYEMKYAMRYRVHKYSIRMTDDPSKLELFLNSLEGDVVAVIPNVTPFPATFVNFILVIEKLT